MEAKRCSLLEAARNNPPLRTLPVAPVSGPLRGLGVKSRWLSGPTEKHYLCRSQAARYTHIVYLDEEVQPPRCRIIVEPYSAPSTRRAVVSAEAHSKPSPPQPGTGVPSGQAPTPKACATASPMV